MHAQTSRKLAFCQNRALFQDVISTIFVDQRLSSHTEAYEWDNEKFVNSSQVAPSSRSPQRNYTQCRHAKEHVNCQS